MTLTRILQSSSLDLAALISWILSKIGFLLVFISWIGLNFFVVSPLYMSRSYNFSGNSMKLKSKQIESKYYRPSEVSTRLSRIVWVTEKDTLLDLPFEDFLVSELSCLSYKDLRVSLMVSAISGASTLTARYLISKGKPFSLWLENRYTTAESHFCSWNFPAF